MNAPGQPRPKIPPPPPGALAAALLLWGWQAGWLSWAAAMAVVLEGARWLRFRLEPGQEDFNRLWNFTILLFLALGLYLFFAREGVQAVGTVVSTNSEGARLRGLRQISQTAVLFLRWVPVVLFPFLALHAWSSAGPLPWSTFSFYLRQEQERRAATPGPTPPPVARRTLHPAWPYLGLTLFASCATTDHAIWFLPLLAVALGWALWPWRNRRFPGWVWVGMWLLLLATAAGAERGLFQLRGLWQQWENRLWAGMGNDQFDPTRNFTAIGTVGRLKQSGRIILRVETTGAPPPRLLREAAFNTYRRGVWVAAQRDFQPLLPEVERSLWRLSPQRASSDPITLSRYTVRTRAPLAMPEGAVTLTDLDALTVETNSLGAARAVGAPPLLRWSVQSAPDGGFDGPPDPADLDLEDLVVADRRTIYQVAGELGLRPGMPPQQAIDIVRNHFARHFEYSLWQRRRVLRRDLSALGVFLTETHAGHCEYFATATTLLLRVAGVPTRYAVGYAVMEEHAPGWVVRGRDAHAWCLAWVDGRWQTVDTTPTDWFGLEERARHWWEPVRDWFSDLWFQFALWRQEGGNWRIWVFVVGMLLLAWLGWRQLRGSRWRRVRQTRREERRRRRRLPGAGSEFYAVVRQLEATHGPRLAHETLRTWRRRLGGEFNGRGAALDEMLALHYRLRFDPRGLDPAERARLRQLAAEWTAAGKPPGRSP